MEDRDLIMINRRGKFSLDEARRVLPVVRRITIEFSSKVELLIARLETLPLNHTETICSLEKQVNDFVQQWNDKIRKLGAEPRGLWFVDFDSGHGYFSWKQPEVDIVYWHSYEESHENRTLIPVEN